MKFDKEKTKPGRFYIDIDTSIYVDMMQRKGIFQHGKIPI